MVNLCEAYDKIQVKFLKSEMIWGAVTSASVGPLCFISPKSNADVIRRFWSTLCFHLLTSFIEMLSFLFQQDFSTCPHCQNHLPYSVNNMVCWPWFPVLDWASQLAWPEPHWESTYRRAEGNKNQSDLGFNNASAEPPYHATLKQ